MTGYDPGETVRGQTMRLVIPSVLLLSLLLLAPQSIAAQEFIRGDANSDAELDLADAIFILNYLFLGHQPPLCLDSADVDDSGTLEITDPVYLLNFLFLGGPSPKPPFPEGGTDPTPDNLRSCGRSLGFETLTQGEYAHFVPEQTTIIQDQDSWEAFWSQHVRGQSSPPPLPDIDFEMETVVVLVRHFGSSGHFVEINEIVALPGKISIFFTQIEPWDGCGTTDAETQPHHYVRTEKVFGDSMSGAKVLTSCCDPMDTTGDFCTVDLGFAWDGSRCIGLNGCECEGRDCGRLYETLEDCRMAHQHCLTETDP